jgi:hypothetical protein
VCVCVCVVVVVVVVVVVGVIVVVAVERVSHSNLFQVSEYQSPRANISSYVEPYK